MKKREENLFRVALVKDKGCSNCDAGMPRHRFTIGHGQYQWIHRDAHGHMRDCSVQADSISYLANIVDG